VIRTPTSTIGIRGSSALVLYSNGRTIAIFIAGNRLCVATNGGQSCTTRPGGVLTEDGYQGRVAPEFLAFILGLIDGQPVVAAQGSFGSGVQGAGRRRAAGRSRPMASGYDERIFEDGFTAETLIGLIGRAVRSAAPGRRGRRRRRRTTTRSIRRPIPIRRLIPIRRRPGLD
jgi:hypothetical protein